MNLRKKFEQLEQVEPKLAKMVMEKAKSFKSGPMLFQSFLGVDPKLHHILHAACCWAIRAKDN